MREHVVQGVDVMGRLGGGLAQEQVANLQRITCGNFGRVCGSYRGQQRKRKCSKEVVTHTRRSNIHEYSLICPYMRFFCGESTGYSRRMDVSGRCGALDLR